LKRAAFAGRAFCLVIWKEVSGITNIHDSAERVAELKAAGKQLQELIRRELVVAEPLAIEAPIIRYDRDEALRRPVDPQVAKAMVYIRKRMRQLAKRHRHRK
jgi:hypothetical protein